jgi:hypothetical protein
MGIVKPPQAGRRAIVVIVVDDRLPAVARNAS